VSKIKKAKNIFFGSTLRKCIVLFMFIFLFVLIGGTLSINYLNDAVTNSHIHSETVLVSDKMYGDSRFSDYYLVIGDNKTYSIVDHGDGYGAKMFDSINVGDKYRFVVKEPELTDVNQFIHILQVHNMTE
jgi:hypothetical protein